MADIMLISLFSCRTGKMIQIEYKGFPEKFKRDEEVKRKNPETVSSAWDSVLHTGLFFRSKTASIYGKSSRNTELRRTSTDSGFCIFYFDRGLHFKYSMVM